MASVKVGFYGHVRQYHNLKSEIDAAIHEVLESGSYVMGPKLKQFEKDLAVYCHTKEAVGVNSGTDALWLVFMALGIGPGDEVITTSNTFFATAEAIWIAGATAVFVDCDPKTCNIDVNLIEAAITPKTKAIVPVHLYGQPADWTIFARLGQERGLKLIEDAAQAWGAEWQGVKAGNLGDIAAFSFYPTKNLSAAGDAGMVTTNSAELAERVKMLRQHGMRRRYYHDEIGWNTRLDGIQAAILHVKLKYIAAWNSARRTVARRYHALFHAAGLAESGPYPIHGVVLPHEVPGSHHIWHQYVVRTRRRDALREFLAIRGIGSEIYYPVPLHLQDALKSLSYNQGSFPESERAAREVLALPIFPELREDEQQTVVGAIAEFLS